MHMVYEFVISNKIRKVKQKSQITVDGNREPLQSKKGMMQYLREIFWEVCLGRKG